MLIPDPLQNRIAASFSSAGTEAMTAVTAETLSPPADRGWMTLFLNVKGEKEGYDFCVNRQAPRGGKTAVEAATENGWEPCGEADIRFVGNQLMLRLSKALLGFGKEDAPGFAFKWADNYEDGNILSFYTRGDSAPYGRLNWVFGAYAPLDAAKRR